MIATTRPPDAPKDAAYLWFDEDDDLDAAAERFFERYGYEPQFLWVDGYLRLGPIYERDDSNRIRKESDE